MMSKKKRQDSVAKIFLHAWTKRDWGGETISVFECKAEG